MTARMEKIKQKYKEFQQDILTEFGEDVSIFFTAFDPKSGESMRAFGEVSRVSMAITLLDCVQIIGKMDKQNDLEKMVEALQ